MAASCPYCLADLQEVSAYETSCPACGLPLDPRCCPAAVATTLNTTPSIPDLDASTNPNPASSTPDIDSEMPSGTAVHDETLTGSAPPPIFYAGLLTGRSEYNLGGMIQKGGMAIVYEARQTAIERTIAIKMIKPELSGKALFRERFLYEAAVTGDLEHPNIVPIYDLGTNERGEPFYAMRCIPGQPWSKVLRERTLPENVAILMDVADAVAFAHSRGVIHRDLKPANVMLGEYGEVLVIDWGIAVSFAPHGKAARLTPETAEYGTLPYMAPEMAAGDITRIGPRSDVYLLGAILFEILTGRPPHHGKNHKTLRHNARNNIIAGTDLDHELLAVALRAMATNPADRYPGVKEFQQAVREVQSHAESMNLSRRALAVLEQARSSGSYDAFAEALFTAQEALRLWAESRHAAQTVTATRQAWAACACDKGDLDLAETLLEAGGLLQTETGARVGTLKEQRRRLAEEKSALERRIAGEERREWQLAFEDDFSEPDFETRWQAVGGECRWRPGELAVRGGRPQLLIARLDLPGDVRIEFECRQEGETISDLNCFLGAPPDDDLDLLEADAYSFKLGALDNHRTGLYRLGKPLYEESGSPLLAGRRFRICAERVGPRLTFSVNGRVICDLVDPAPLPCAGRGVVGLAGWFAETRYTAVRLWRLGAPLKADLLELAEKYLARGRHETAIDLYEDAAAAAVDPERLRRASAGLERARMLRELHRDLPELQARLAAFWPRAALRIGDHGLCLSIDACGVTDLAPLTGLPLTDLECEDNRIASLEALRGMPLRRLICKGNTIESLEPLRGMPLETLDCSNNRITSLEPLRGMRLDVLRSFNNPIVMKLD